MDDVNAAFGKIDETLKANADAVAACSARCAASRTDADGCTHRQTEFRFVQFREYP